MLLLDYTTEYNKNLFLFSTLYYMPFELKIPPSFGESYPSQVDRMGKLFFAINLSQSAELQNAGIHKFSFLIVQGM